jgi:tRNA(Arg) A34 adenosine deaminase TadA
MNIIPKRALIKAAASSCRYKIAAIGFNRKNEIVGITYNSPRLRRLGGSTHAEINLLKRCGRKLRSIMVVRVGQSSNLLPIETCQNCKDALKGIRILKTKI